MNSFIFRKKANHELDQLMHANIPSPSMHDSAEKIDIQFDRKEILLIRHTDRVSGSSS
jgi:hypothetical protein